MQLSQVPVQIVKAWATAGSKTNPIPVPSQVGITPGAASWTDGFPPLCDTSLILGGIPPSMQDTNGGLYQMSAIDLWMCAGGGFPYNSAFSAAIGGYPKGARVLMASGNGYWVSTVDNNVTDPDTGGAGWARADENAITALTGPVTATGPGSVAATITPTGVTAGSYAGANITVNAAGQVTAATSLPFTGTSGYQELSSGLILQWGTASAAEGTQNSTLTGSFALAFPTAVFSVQLSIYDSAQTDYSTMPVASLLSKSTSGFTFHWYRNADHGSTSSQVVEYWAVGY